MASSTRTTDYYETVETSLSLCAYCHIHLLYDHRVNVRNFPYIMTNGTTCESPAICLAASCIFANSQYLLDCVVKSNRGELPSMRHAITTTHSLGRSIIQRKATSSRRTLSSVRVFKQRSIPDTVIFAFLC
eukprot:490986_1